MLFSFSPLPSIVRYRALAEIVGGAHLGNEMTAFRGTANEAVKVFTLHTISCSVFTSGLATANVRSQFGSNSVLCSPLPPVPPHQFSFSSIVDDKLKRISAESVGFPVPPPHNAPQSQRRAINCCLGLD